MGILKIDDDHDVNSSIARGKRCKFHFFTSLDKNTWINKGDLLNYIRKMRKSKSRDALIKEIEKCEYQGLTNDK